MVQYFGNSNKETLIQTKGQLRALRNSWNGAKVNQQTLGVIKSELAG